MKNINCPVVVLVAVSKRVDCLVLVDHADCTRTVEVVKGQAAAAAAAVAARAVLTTIQLVENQTAQVVAVRAAVTTIQTTSSVEDLEVSSLLDFSVEEAEAGESS